MHLNYKIFSTILTIIVFAIIIIIIKTYCDKLGGTFLLLVLYITVLMVWKIWWISDDFHAKT
jgi:hypothetical protein